MLFQGLITLTDNIICTSSLLDPLFITQLRRGKTTFRLSQKVTQVVLESLAKLYLNFSVTLVQNGL